MADHEPCPFCGEKESLMPVHYVTKKKVSRGYIECGECGAKGPMTTLDPASLAILSGDIIECLWFSWDERADE